MLNCFYPISLPIWSPQRCSRRTKNPEDKKSLIQKCSNSLIAHKLCTFVLFFFCFFCVYGSLPDAGICWCLRTGGGGVVTRWYIEIVWCPVLPWFFPHCHLRLGRWVVLQWFFLQNFCLFLIWLPLFHSFCALGQRLVIEWCTLLPWLVLWCLSLPSCPKRTAASANMDNIGTVWRMPFEWLSKFSKQAIKTWWTCALARTGICPICYCMNKPCHVPTLWSLLNELDLNLDIIHSGPAMQPAAQSSKAPSPSPPSWRGSEASVGGFLVSGSATSGMMASALPTLPVLLRMIWMTIFDGLVMKMVWTTATLLSLNLPLLVICHPPIILRLFPHHSLPLLLPHASFLPNLYSLWSGLSARLWFGLCEAPILVVADTGTTDHMFPDALAFISYKPVMDLSVRMGNNLFVPVLGRALHFFLEQETLACSECPPHPRFGSPSLQPAGQPPSMRVWHPRYLWRWFPHVFSIFCYLEGHVVSLSSYLQIPRQFGNLPLPSLCSTVMRGQASSFGNFSIILIIYSTCYYNWRWGRGFGLWCFSWQQSCYCCPCQPVGLTFSISIWSPWDFWSTWLMILPHGAPLTECSHQGNGRSSFPCSHLEQSHYWCLVRWFSFHLTSFYHVTGWCCVAGPSQRIGASLGASMWYC